MEPPPSLRHALAVAQLLRKRCAAAVAEAQQRSDELQAEVEGLRRASEVPRPPRPPRPPLELLMETPAAKAPPPGMCPAPPPPATNTGTLHHQQLSLAMWHEAAALLPADLHPALAAAQRYLLLNELHGHGHQPGGGRLLACTALEHTPVQALLGLATDVLRAHQAAAAPVAPAATQPAAVDALDRPEAAVLLTAAHGSLLASCCACLVRLCNSPGRGALDPDFAVLQRFCCMVLALAAEPPPSPATAPPADTACLPAVATTQGPGAGATAARNQQASSAAATAAASGKLDLRQPSCVVAEFVLAALRQSAPAGIVLLSSAADLTHAALAALVTAVTGEQPSAPCGAAAARAAACGHGGSKGIGSWSGELTGPTPVADSADGSAGEHRLLHVLAQLSEQLSAGLRLLPHWAQALGSHNDEFMQVRLGKGGRQGRHGGTCQVSAASPGLHNLARRT